MSLPKEEMIEILQNEIETLKKRLERKEKELEELKAEQYYANEMVKPIKCHCGELFDGKDSSFCPKCGCAYGELSGRYTNIGR